MARTKTKPVGRTPIKRQACEAWLATRLAGRPWPARNILRLGAKLGWGWATVRRAKVNLGAQSFKKGNEWWWFDPNTYTPAPAPLRVVAKNPPPQVVEKVSEMHEVVEPPNLPQAMAAVAGQQETFETPKRLTSDIDQPDQSIENRSKKFAPSVSPPSPIPKQEIPKPVEPLKPLEPPKLRRVRIWDSEITETRDTLISSAGFADLYTMRADILLRQEQLRAKHLVKEELALNQLLSRINEALENKKRAENLE